MTRGVVSEYIAGHPIIRSRRRTISIEIQHNGTCIVRAPLRASRSSIKSFIVHKHNWITKNQERMRIRFAHRPRYAFVSGELFPVFGKWCRLHIISRKMQQEELTFSRGMFFLVSHADARKAFRLWYKQHGIHEIAKCVEKHASSVGVFPRSVRMSHAQCQWGSCGHRGDLRFSWRVSMLPLPVVDAIAAHEVAHLVERNHSQSFHALLRQLCPEYDAHDRWLKKYEHRLNI